MNEGDSPLHMIHYPRSTSMVNARTCIAAAFLLLVQGCGTSPPFPPLASTGPSAVAANFYSYFMDTTTTATFPFGQAMIKTIGQSGRFQVCGNNPGATGTVNYVAYVNGIRSSGVVSISGGCSPVLTVGAGGDFQVSIRRAWIVGAHSGDDPTSTSYNLYGVSQLLPPGT